MKSRSASWLLLCVALVALGCAKGDTGPTGPAGETGSANVICSDWYSPSTWNAEAEWGAAQRTYTMPDTLLTQECHRTLISGHGRTLQRRPPRGRTW
jgi:hypothetical protein